MKFEGKYTWDEKPLREFMVAMKEFARESIRVGVVGPEANAVHPTSHGELTVGEIALIQELGTYTNGGHIPPRPFLKETFLNTVMVKEVLVEAARRVIHKYSSPHQALTRAGEAFANAVRSTLLEGVGPANAQATIDWKGHGDTLIGLSDALYDAIGFVIGGNDVE